MTTNPIQAMLEAGIIDTTDFPPDSRWHGAEQATIEGPDGREIRYLRRRFPPDPALFATLRQRVVLQGERLDHLAAEELGNPEAFWMLCDANGVIFAEELETVGGVVEITLPAGVPAGTEE